jgi:predicted membrane chloride channel (bestrophin family)
MDEFTASLAVLVCVLFAFIAIAWLGWWGAPLAALIGYAALSQLNTPERVRKRPKL